MADIYLSHVSKCQKEVKCRKITAGHGGGLQTITRHNKVHT